MSLSANLLTAEVASLARRVLVVDSNPGGARMVAEFLKTLGVGSISLETSGSGALHKGRLWGQGARTGTF